MKLDCEAIRETIKKLKVEELEAAIKEDVNGVCMEKINNLTDLFPHIIYTL